MIFFCYLMKPFIYYFMLEFFVLVSNTQEVLAFLAAKYETPNHFPQELLRPLDSFGYGDQLRVK